LSSSFSYTNQLFGPYSVGGQHCLAGLSTNDLFFLNETVFIVIWKDNSFELVYLTGSIFSLYVVQF